MAEFTSHIGTAAAYRLLAARLDEAIGRVDFLAREASVTDGRWRPQKRDRPCVVFDRYPTVIPVVFAA